jgi:hypothetical protein
MTISQCHLTGRPVKLTLYEAFALPSALQGAPQALTDCELLREILERPRHNASSQDGGGKCFDKWKLHCGDFGTALGPLFFPFYFHWCHTLLALFLIPGILTGPEYVHAS